MANHANLVTVVVTGKLAAALTQAPASAATAKPASAAGCWVRRCSVHFPACARAHGTETALTGALPDQAALFGVLSHIEALGIELLEVRRMRS
jgi:hypothetical protein